MEYIEGEKINRLTAVKDLGLLHYASGKSRGRCIKVRCDCGGEKVITLSRFKSGKTISCGCYQKEIAKQRRGSTNSGNSENHSAWRNVYNHIRRNAIIRGLSFELSLQNIKDICSKPCVYCGTEPFAIKSYSDTQQVKYNGLDRVDNSLGYTLKNVVPCCKYCNKAKLDRSVDEFLEWVKKVYSFRIDKTFKNVYTVENKETREVN